MNQFLASSLLYFLITQIQAAPLIGKRDASQCAGTKRLEVSCNLAAPESASVAVSLKVSSGGEATRTPPAMTAGGDSCDSCDSGARVAPDTRNAADWEAGVDWPQRRSTQMRLRGGVDALVPEGMALIPAGSFTMGVTSGDTDIDEPPVDVTVSAFYIQQTETTKAQWAEVRTWGLSHGYTDLPTGEGKAANHPVHSVSWWDAVKWCNARSEKEELKPVYAVGGVPMKTGHAVPEVNWSANGYRLPTEAEWEKAARGGVSGKRFPWGTDTISHAEANYRVYSSNGTRNLYSYDVEPRPPASGMDYFHPSYTAGGTPYTSPVGSFGANGYRLYDMAGNVFEWCWDWYGARTYVDDAVDPRGAVSGLNRVIRGGGWGTSAIRCRAAYRNFSTPFNRSSSNGFRPVRTPSAR